MINLERGARVGYTVEILCEECKFRKVYNLGRTSQKEPLKEILKCFTVEVDTTIKQLDSAYNMRNYDYGNYAMACGKCNEISSNIILKVRFSNDLEYIPKYFCKKCNAKLTSLEKLEDLARCNCPSCGKVALIYKDVCDWD